MRKIWVLLVVVLLSACNSGYEIYRDYDSRFNQLGDAPEVFVIVKRDAGVYYKVIHFTSDWEFLNGNFSGNMVRRGYYIADEQGFNGYDLQRRHESLNEAIDAARSAGHIYEYPLGREYNYQSGGFYHNSPFKKLERK